jgi:hypothetical protein
MYAYETSKYLNHQKVYRLAMRTRENQKCASCGTRTVLIDDHQLELKDRSTRQDRGYCFSSLGRTWVLRN